ncbi:MAG: transposase [Treponema sp.]|nr:transposase [Treponema sp.]
MRKKREFIEGAFYHVTSRTNNKIRVFENKLGRKIMEITLQDAKDKFHFRLTNFCIMPTHIHLLIKPKEGTNLSCIMHWIKKQSAKRWNFIHGSTDHMWGHRYFSRAVKDQQEYDSVMDYIDQNPVKAELSLKPEEWRASGAFYKSQGLTELVDYDQFEEKKYKDVKLLMPVQYIVSNLLPSAQLEKTIKYYGTYALDLERLYKTVKQIPSLSGTKSNKAMYTYLRYYTPTSDYFIYEYDKEDIMFGKFRLNIFPHTIEYRNFNLAKLKTIQDIKIDLTWVPATTFS